MFAKRRRPWKRGPKMRYSVYKAEDRIDGEKDYEEMARTMAEAKGYDITDFLALEHKNMWQETYTRLAEHWYKQRGYRPPWEAKV